MKRNRGVFAPPVPPAGHCSKGHYSLPVEGAILLAVEICGKEVRTNDRFVEIPEELHRLVPWVEFAAVVSEDGLAEKQLPSSRSDHDFNFDIAV